MYRYKIFFKKKHSKLFKITTFYHYLYITQLKFKFSSYYIQSSSNRFFQRIVLKSPFHYKLVKYNTYHPTNQFNLIWVFYSYSAPHYIFKTIQLMRPFVSELRIEYDYCRCDLNFLIHIHLKRNNGQKKHD